MLRVGKYDLSLDEGLTFFSRKHRLSLFLSFFVFGELFHRADETRPTYCSEFVI